MRAEPALGVDTEVPLGARRFVTRGIA